MDARLHPAFWRHDAYTLKCLHRAIAAQIAGAGLPEHCVVVDLGAGTAPYRSMFAGAHRQYIPCDLEGSEAASVTLQIGEEVPLADASADWVVSFQVLEHVWDLDWYLAQCRRLLKPDGKLLLSTHGTWLYHPHPTDFRRWTRTGLVAELESRGFTMETITPVVGPLAWTTQFRTLGYHHMLARIPLAGPILSAALCSVMHLRMILEDAITPVSQTEHNAAVYVVLARPT